MYFNINKKDLLEKLNIAAKAISNTTPLPALSGIKFEINKDVINLVSSDSNISILCSFKNEESHQVFDVKEEGEIVIDARYILEIVRKIDSDIVNFETIDGDLIKIFGLNSEFKINGINADNYPNINFDLDNSVDFEIECEKFFKIINQTAFACSVSDIKVILTGVNFKAVDGKLVVNATDSYRLAYKKVDLDSNDKLDFNITVPTKYLNDVYHSIPSTLDKLKISINNQKISFEFYDTIIQTRLLDEAFPDTTKLIPTSFTQKLEVKAKDLAEAIDRASFIKSDGKNIVKLAINSQNVNITAANQIGSSYENIPVTYFEGKEFEISCSGKYLIDAIKAIDEDDIVLSFSGELRPFLITPKEDDSIIQLISPVRTYK